MTRALYESPRRHRPERPAPFTVVGCLCLGWALGGCSAPSVHFEVDYPSTPSIEVAAVSVLGVYRNGQLDQQSWRSLAEELPPAFSQQPCVGFGPKLRRENPAVYQVLAESTYLSETNRLEELSPAAKSPHILAIEIFGEPAPEFGSNDTRTPVQIAHGGGGGGEFLPTGQEPVAPIKDEPDLEMTATVLSVETQELYFKLTMHFSGGTEKEGFQEFAWRLMETFPELTCGQWNWRQIRVVREVDVAGLPLRRVTLQPVD